MSSLAIVSIAALPLALALAPSCAYLLIRYAPIVGRIFEEKPLFLPLRLAAEPGGEDVRFRTARRPGAGGHLLSGANTQPAAGVVVFCHEFLSDRWSFVPYADPLRDLGFDLFTFDFRNHGESEAEPAYKPLQWVTDHEVRDLRAALAYLRSRPDPTRPASASSASAGAAATALCVAAKDPSVWGVVTDGAFPTRGTMLAYIRRWAEIYVGEHVLWRDHLPGLGLRLRRLGRPRPLGASAATAGSRTSSGPSAGSARAPG